MTATLSRHLQLQMMLGEGLHWHPEHQALYWVDILGHALHRLDFATGIHTTIDQGEAITCITHRTGGGFIAALRSGLWHLDDNGHKQDHLVEFPEDSTNHRFNDGGCDPSGRFWIGSMNEHGTRADASLYCYDGNTLTPHIGGMTITNGLAFSPDGRWLYHTDTPTRVIRRHAFSPESGEPGPGEIWVDLNTLNVEGNPDGAAVDDEGCYWIAMFGGAAVLKFSPTGELLARYPLPALQPTMPMFAGPDRRTLFVTTARENMDDTALAKWPGSGSLFSMRVNVPGHPLAACQV